MRTRAQKAGRLFDDACHGPAFDDHEAYRTYRLWSTTWLLPAIIELVPQLKGRKSPPMTEEPDAFWKDHPLEPMMCGSCNQGAKREWTYCPYCGAQARVQHRPAA